MTKIVLVLVTAAAAGSAVLTERTHSTPSTQAQGDVEAEIRAAHEQMMQAAQRRDVEALYAFVLDGDTPPIIEDGQVRGTRAAAHQITEQGFRGVTSVDYSYTRRHITVLSPATALWIGEGTGSAVLTDGRQITAPFAETILFVRRDGQWKVLHAHRSAPNR